ncbi:Cathepsin D-like aspartic proteinase preproprotein [Aphelenchoides besseyi]|nr:Cathepsin D-like aspartic proteinase preproprotein [Aphelenchoides besseyi]
MYYYLLFIVFLRSVVSRSFSTNYQNFNGQLLTTINVGTPEISTNTVDFYVVDSQCVLFAPNCLQNRRGGFDTSTSSTYAAPTSSFIGDYHKSYQNGDTAADLFPDTAATTQIEFGVISQPTGRFVQSNAMAVLGLGFPLIPNSFIMNFLNSAGAPVFNFYLRSFTYMLPNTFDSTGTITFGNTNPNECNINYYYQHLDLRGQWIIKVGHVRMSRTKVRGGLLVVSPSSRYIYGPRTAVNILHRQIRARYNRALREYVVSCSRVQRLPDLKFVVRSHRHVLTAREYTVRSVDSSTCIVLIKPITRQFPSINVEELDSRNR